MKIRVASYNIHGCVGMDRRVLPARTLAVIQELQADVVALQEVYSTPGAAAELHQAQYFIDRFGCDHYFVSENEKRRGASYGNLLLSRIPFRQVCNHDLTRPGREPRSCIHATVNLPEGGGELDIFNVHLGLSARERGEQARAILTSGILAPGRPSILAGDFNEWRAGEATRILTNALQSLHVRNRIPALGSYPGIFPLFHLDNMFFTRGIQLESFTVHRTRLALVTSDHIPLVADFVI